MTIHYIRTGKQWTKWEEQFLKEHLRNMSYIDLANALHRTPKAIKQKLASPMRHAERMPSVDSPYDLWWVSKYVVEYYRKNGP